MIPEHAITLLVVVIAGAILFRWGALILVGYALVHFSLGQWELAALSFCYALFFSWVKAIVLVLAQATGEHR